MKTLVGILKEEPNHPVTGNQGLSISNYIYFQVAKIIGSSFYSLHYSTSRPTLKRSPNSDFDHTQLSSYLSQMVGDLEKMPYTSYVELEGAISTCIATIVDMRETSNAA